MPHLPRWPGVQGLRGLAVGGVLLYHHDPGWLPGGFLGVSLFFTLSGFLITDLLLRERRRSGGIAIRRFWARRARRLAPVALVGLALAAAVAPFIATEGELSSISWDVLAASVDVANWRFAFDEVAYADLFTLPSPVTHYWSLAIEEQFYLLFPLVVLALRTERRLAVALVALVAASVAAQTLIADPNRVYLGTDTRASELAVGALLAIGWRGRERAASRWLDAVAAPVLLLVVGMWAVVELRSPLLRDGGLTLVALLSAVLVAASVGGRTAPRVLGWRPLALVGDHSYGLYVFHFPLYLLLSPERTGLDGVPLLLARLAASAIVCVAVAWAVEHPVRWRSALAGWQAPLAMGTATAAIAVVAVALPHVGSRLDAADDTIVLAGDVATVVTMPPVTVPPAAPDAASPGGGASVGSTPTPEPTAPPPAGGGQPAATGGYAATTPAPRVLLVGDSTAETLARGMIAWTSRTGRVLVDRVAGPACALYRPGDMVHREGWRVASRPACHELIDAAVAFGRENPPDAVILFLGNSQLSDWVPEGSTQRTGFGDPAYDAGYRAAADDALTQLESIGVPVLLATVPTPAWVPELTTPNAVPPGHGEPTMNNPVRTAILNAINAQLDAEHELVGLLPWAERLDPSLRADGLHVFEDITEQLMDLWLEATMRTAYQAVLGASTPARATLWSVRVAS